jgi:apolipoprotein N-acyltransferase
MILFFKALPLWVRSILTVLIGMVGALAQAPFDLVPLIIVMMAGGFLILSTAHSTRNAIHFGFLIGFGYFLVTLHWITSPFQVDAEQHAWMAPFALIFMASGMGLFWALAFGVARFLGPVWALALTWPLVELLRAYVFTGFPWGTPPQALVDVLAGQGLAWVGPHGMMLGMSLLAWLIFKLLKASKVGLFGVVGAVLLVTLLPPLRPDAELTKYTIRLIQPNAAQKDKWDPEKSRIFVDRLLQFTQAGEIPDLVLWPETAVPYLAHNAPGLLQAAGEAGRGSPVAMGILRAEGTKLFNSMIVLNETGQSIQTYDKHHLVPFGEYIPLRPILSAIGLRAMADMFGDGFARGKGAEVVDFGPLGKALPLICYEAVFAHDVGAMPERPNFLIQLTNDAWFGNFAGPKQHLAQAQMRAIEQGLPMARAANTGISAMIDPYGRILDNLDLNEAGFVDAKLPLPLASTPYSRVGDLPVAILLLIVAMMTLVLKLTRRPTT